MLPAPPRKSGWRIYDTAALERLKVICAARAAGFSLEETRLLLDGFPKDTPPSLRWQKLARRKLPELEALIQRTMALKYLIEAGLDCDCDDIALCLNSQGEACKPPRRIGGISPSHGDTCSSHCA